MPSAPSPLNRWQKPARPGWKKNLRQMISIVWVCPLCPASVVAKGMWRWCLGRSTIISSKLVKIVYLIAMASLVNNFLSYLDFGMRAKWSREREREKKAFHQIIIIDNSNGSSNKNNQWQEQRSRSHTCENDRRRATTRLFHACVFSILLPKRDDHFRLTGHVHVWWVCACVYAL